MMKLLTKVMSIFRIFATVLVIITSIILIWSFLLEGRFKPNPELQAQLDDVTLRMANDFGMFTDNGPLYRISASEFICAGNASWEGGSGGMWVSRGLTTKKAIFKCVLEKIVPKDRYGNDSKQQDISENDLVPMYLKVTDLFGADIKVETISMSSWQLTWIQIQKIISNSLFRAIAVVFIIGYVAFFILWKVRAHGKRTSISDN